MEWQQIIEQKHAETLKAVELARNGEEQANDEVAVINYKLGIKLIDEALATPVALPDDLDEVDQSWYVSLKTVQSLKRMRGELVHRIGQLTPSTSNDVEAVSPIANVKPSKRPRTFIELAEALHNLEFTDTDNLPSVLELLFACDGVKLYHINANGEVSTECESSTLRIIRLDQDVTQNFDATYFMQIIRTSAAESIQADIEVDNTDDNNDEITQAIENETNISGGDDIPSKKVRSNTPPNPIDASLIYPLVAGVSPCFRTDFGAFIFPDIQSDVRGAAYGLVIPVGTDEIVLEILDSILHGIVRQAGTEDGIEEAIEAGAEDEEEDEHARHKRHASERISENIVQGACLLSNGLVKGTEQVGKLISYTTPYIISKLNGAPNRIEPLPTKVTTGVEIAKSATGMAVGVTSFVAGKVGSATMALGKFLAPHVHAKGSQLLSRTMGYGEDEAKDKMGGVLTVAAGAVEGFGTVYDGLEKSAGILGKNLSQNSVKIIQHKYGTNAGALATDTFDTVGNLINLNKNVRGLITPKGLAKRTFKGTGKAIVGDYKPHAPMQYVPAGSLYPDLTEFSNKLALAASQN